MTAAEWRAKSEAAAEVVELVLPSGMVIRARRPGPMQFAAWDKLPMLLAGAQGEAGAADAAEVAGFLRELLTYCCVSPKVPEEIEPREICEQDWVRIVRWAMRVEEAAVVRPFRGVGTNGGGDGDGEAVFVQTIGTDGDSGPGDGAGVRPGGLRAVERAGARRE